MSTRHPKNPTPKEQNQKKVATPTKTTFQFVDNRPEASAQRDRQKLVEQSPQVLQAKKRKEQVQQHIASGKTYQFSGRSQRRAARNNPFGGTRHHGRRVEDHIYSTRFSEQVRGRDTQQVTMAQAKGIIRRKIKASAKWWNGKRPSWDDTADTVYANAKSRVKNGRTEYLCFVKGGTAYLPKKGSVLNDDEEFATIGHKKQWLEYITEKVDQHDVKVISKDTRLAVASASGILQTDARRLYNDIDNLRLEGNKYNSSIAHQYTLDRDNPTYVYFTVLLEGTLAGKNSAQLRDDLEVQE